MCRHYPTLQFFFFFFSNLALADCWMFLWKCFPLHASQHTHIRARACWSTDLHCWDRFSSLSTRRCLPLKPYHIDDWTHFYIARKIMATHMQTKISMSGTMRADFIVVFVLCWQKCHWINNGHFYWQVKCAHSNGLARKRVLFSIELGADGIFLFDFFWLNPQRMNFILHSTK